MASTPDRDSRSPVALHRRTPKPFLELREIGSFDVRCVPLEPGRHVIGRSPELAVVLPHVSVSRYHAELVSDPHGRWWIHDLSSTNGTHVNGVRVNQRRLNAGDTIQTGDYVLKFRFPPAHGERVSPVTEPPSSEESPTSAGRDVAVQSEQLGAAHLRSATLLSRSLLQRDKKRQRVEALLEHCVGDGFPGASSWVVRLRRDTAPKLYAGPLRRASEEVVERLRYASQLEALSAEHEKALFDSSGPQLFSTGDLDFVAAPIETEPDGMYVLYVQLPKFAGSEDWQALLGLAIDSYRQANEVREAREHVRYTAIVDRELDMARQIQERFVPAAPATNALEIAIRYEPCQWVGGDYVDSVELADGRLLVVCADVCGKGLQATLVTSSLHTLLHTLVDVESSLEQIAARMNRYLRRFLPERSFVTLAAVAIDPQSGELEYVNAGHPAPLLVSADAVQRLPAGDTSPLGLIDTEFYSQRHQLTPGDVLLLYSDGVIDAEDANRRPLGEERLGHEFCATVSNLNDASVETVLESLSKTVSVHRGSTMASDDATFLVVRWSGERVPPSGITTVIPEPP